MKNRKLLAFVLAFVLLLAFLTGCGAKHAASDSYATADYAAAPEPAYAEEAYDVEESKADYALGAGNSDLTSESGDETLGRTSALAEKIIYSGSLYIETTKFDDAIAAVEAKVKEFGGFIESSEINGSTKYRADGTTSLEDRSAYYVVRVPCDRFDAFVKQSGTLGNVLSSNTSADNITSQFTDAEARKASLKVQEERLLAMMEKTDDIENLIALEERLSEVRYEYESIERRLINWQNQVDYSTVSLNLKEVAVYTPVVPVQRTFGEKLGSAFADGWNGFVRFCENLALFLAEALPTLVLLALIGLAIWLIVRAIVRGSRKKREAKRAAAAAARAAAPNPARPVAPAPVRPTPPQDPEN